MTKQHDKKLEELNQQIAELTNALLRERADAMNVRRRSDEERAKLGSFYKANVVRELLPVLDNFERALKHMPKIEKSEIKTQKSEEKQLHDWAGGVQKIVQQFEEALKKIGVERIKTVGEPFNPHLHEAVSHDEGDGEETVSEELQAGYILGDEVIRHAMVRVKG